MNAQEKRLTEEQSAFAEKHHHVVMDFLRRKRLPESEFYDVVIFRYLRAVQLYCINPQLRRYKFEAIAFKAMDWQMKSYWRKAYKMPHKTRSLDEQLAGSGLTLHEVIPADGFDAGDEACDRLTAEALLAAYASWPASRRLFREGNRRPHGHIVRPGRGYVFMYPKHCDSDGITTPHYISDRR